MPAMFTTVAAMALVAVMPAQMVGPSAAPGEGPNAARALPPLGCLQMFPPHAWCVAQEEAATAFIDRCERELRRLQLAGMGEGSPTVRWRALRNQAVVSRDLWRMLAEAQDEANPLDETERHERLNIILSFSDDDAFHAGRMPPPVPDDAPRD
jgi:hypothetical protein